MYGRFLRVLWIAAGIVVVLLIWNAISIDDFNEAHVAFAFIIPAVIGALAVLRWILFGSEKKD